MTEVKEGDRVRVVLEGEASVSNYYNDGFLIGERSENLINPNWKHVKSVEVLSRSFKVGDTVEGGDYAKLPVGTVAGRGGGRVYKSGPNNWVDSYGNYEDRHIQDPRTIEYLP